MISITNAAKEPHITPLQDSMWHRGMAGIDSCVFNFFENFAAEVSSNNSVKIRSGIGMIQGRYFCVEPSTYDEVTIANGTQGEKRKDLIVCRWTVNEEQKVQSGDWVVIQGTPTTGTPAAPAYTAGDLDAGDLIADMPFYEVTLDGINVTGVVQKFTSLSGIGKLVSDETIQMFKEAGYPISDGITDECLQALLNMSKDADSIISDVTQQSGNRKMRTVKHANGDMEQYMYASNVPMTFATNGNAYVDYVTFDVLEAFENTKEVLVYASCISNAGISFGWCNEFVGKSAIAYFKCLGAGSRTIQYLTMYAKGKWK